MDELRELYQQIILDHNKNPKNFKKLEPHTHTAEGYNPLCGDRLNLYLNVHEGVIEDVGFEGSGCAISKASASVMTTAVKGKKLNEVQALFDIFQKVVKSDRGEPVDVDALGKLAVFAGVRDFPVRIKCATLAWHTLIAALKNRDEVVSTE